MNTVYADPEHYATVYLMPAVDGDTWLLTSWEINRRFRGKGYAAKLFDRVMEDADKEGIKLLLSVEPDGTGLDELALFSFYESRGFERMSENEFTMIRNPRESRNITQSVTLD